MNADSAIKGGTDEYLDSDGRSVYKSEEFNREGLRKRRRVFTDSPAPDGGI